MSDVLTAPAPPRSASKALKPSYRIESIDLLRGLIMIIMALDHVRDYFHAAAFTDDPLNLSTTTPILYFTRWITHFCAPLFMFLSGTSAFLVGTRRGKKALSRFLFIRGLWLIFLELTIVNFAWFFNIHFTVVFTGVIWALGVSMIALAGLVYLPVVAILIISLLMVFCHNLLDSISVDGSVLSKYMWALLHQQNFFQVNGYSIFAAYPIIPWIGVMALGYCIGTIYKKEVSAEKRKKILLILGSSSIILFVLLRYINVYGDSSHWNTQKTSFFTFLSFMNVSKYPPSLLYLLITIGPGLLFLAISEKWRSWLAEKIKVIGRVPMFYYLVHLYLIHIAAMIATNFCGHKSSDMVSLNTWVSFESKLQGYGFSLGTVYTVWIVLIIVLYFLCKWYDRYKLVHKEKWWLSYL
jgi:uncharacterized membrane protein